MKCLIIHMSALLVAAPLAAGQVAVPASEPATYEIASPAPQAASSPATQPAGVGDEGPAWLGPWRRLQSTLGEQFGTKVGVLLNYQAQGLAGGPQSGQIKNAFSYQLSLEQKLWQGATLVAYGEGGSGQGLDPYLDGTFLGTNDAAGQPACIYASRVYLQQGLLEDRIQVLVGKIDLSYIYDLNEVANDYNAQFLSCSLVNNPTIPFPDAGLGAVVKVQPTEWLYVQAGAADAQASATTTGFHTAFHGEDRFTDMYEVGLSPKIGERGGNYRFILWHQGSPVERLDGSGLKRDDVGLAASFDQQITERLSVFARYGYADPQVSEISNFWSLGAALKGPLPGRDQDVLALGVAQAIPGRDARQFQGLGDKETILELYYRVQVTDYLSITPDIQVLMNPGAGRADSTVVVTGLRAVVEF
jgi:carbohydrate-selective porin OprB